MFEALLQPLLAGGLLGEVASWTSPFSPFSYHLSHSAVDFSTVNLSHPVMVLVSVPFLTAQGAQNPNIPFLSLPSFLGVDGRD